MEKSPDLVLGFTDPALNRIFKEPNGTGGSYTCHFSQEEDFFLRFEDGFQIPSFPIHHPVGNPRPSPAYLEALDRILRQVVARMPGSLTDLTWFFDPRDIFHPGFYQILNFREKKYLCSVKLDLTWRPREGEIIEAGTNNNTPVYRTKSLFVESELLPLEAVILGPRQDRMVYLDKVFPQTWRGESGRGYFVTGRWIDQEISKFLTRLFLSPGKKTHPYYPLRCRFNTMSYWMVDLSPEARKRKLILFHQILEQLRNQAPGISSALKDNLFEEELPLFTALKARTPEDLVSKVGLYRIEAYLNPSEQKEYRYHAELV